MGYCQCPDYNFSFAIASRENAFSSEDDNGITLWDFVVNLAAETKPNQTHAVYEQGIVPLSVGCAELAAKCKVKRYVELSDSHCYSAKKVMIMFALYISLRFLLFRH